MDDTIFQLKDIALARAPKMSSWVHFEQPIYTIIAYALIMPAKTASGLTTVALNREHHERLYNYKSANRCRSMDEAIGLLLDTVESSRSLSPCAR